MKSIYKEIIVFANIALFFFTACEISHVCPNADGFEWYHDENMGIIILNYAGSPGSHVVIPEQINGTPVRTIGGGAFWQSQLVGVIIPDNVTYIWQSAFSNNLLTSVTIPDSVTEIESHAFSHNRLTSVTISNSITSIPFAAFSQNLLTSVTIPDRVTSIEWSAFRNNLLTSIVIGADVDIEISAFGYGFEAFYEENGRLAGTYTRPDTDSTTWIWSK
ncbi:MAG: leucine-rich repeat domain-containing protein [Treponema sp.]|nr:leucine-rich repeat domain-containing protein [Treponema sp.]